LRVLSCRSSSTTLPTPRVRVPRHVARLVALLVAPLVVDYFTYAARPGASACHAARQATRRAARRRLHHLRRASGCLGTSRGSLSTSSTMSRVRVPWYVARLVTRLVVDYFAYAVRPVAPLVAPLVVNFDYAARPGASARHAACRQLRLRCVSGCLDLSRGSSCGSSSTTLCAATPSCGHTGSTSATPCITTTCLAATLALLRVRCAAATSSSGHITSTTHLD
jgi:hypothetical protein